MYLETSQGAAAGHINEVTINDLNPNSWECDEEEEDLLRNKTRRARVFGYNFLADFACPSRSRTHLLSLSLSASDAIQGRGNPLSYLFRER